MAGLCINARASNGEILYVYTYESVVLVSYLLEFPSPSELPPVAIPPTPPQRRLVGGCPWLETAGDKANCVEDACPTSEFDT